MAKAAAILGVHMLDAAPDAGCVGGLMRGADGGVAFGVAEDCLRDANWPVTSLGWFDPC